MRTAFLATVGLAAGALASLTALPAGAQTAFTLDDPFLVVDGERVTWASPPRSGALDGPLLLAVPGLADYSISDGPVPGARRAGEFDGRRLTFSVDGVSIRMVSQSPILGDGRRPAYVRTRQSRTTARGPAQLRSQDAPASVPAIRETPRDERVQADLRRLAAERDRLREERERTLQERRALAAEMERARRESDAVASRANENARREARRLREEVARLRQEVAARDATIERLTAERDDRSEQMDYLRLQVRALSAALATTEAERDQALQERDDAPTNRSAVAALQAELDETRAERDRLAALTAAQRPDTDRLNALTRRLTEAERTVERLTAERDAIEAQLEASERARLGLEAERARREDEQTIAEPDPRRTEREPADGPPARISFPSFDFGRLLNPAEVERQVEAATLPPRAVASGLRGEVLVLLQTDATGRVIQTAVPRPIGGGLDALAEDLVRTMQFRPPRVRGLPTGLRSQVLVRFNGADA
ncbi:MAG: energy transducer TonB [Bacteroidota bacterium]